MLEKSPAEHVFSKICNKVNAYESFSFDCLESLIICYSALPYDDQGNALREKFLPQLLEKMFDLPADTREVMENMLGAKSSQEFVDRQEVVKSYETRHKDTEKGIDV